MYAYFCMYAYIYSARVETFTFFFNFGVLKYQLEEKNGKQSMKTDF